MTGSAPLTARGLKAMLTRAGVDHYTLTITDDPEVWTAALRLMGAGSPQHALARMRLAALDEEFGLPAPR